MENYHHRGMTILKNEEERKKEIQVVKQIARANGYKSEVVYRVTDKMSTRKNQSRNEFGNSNLFLKICRNLRNQIHRSVEVLKNCAICGKYTHKMI
mgnify:CR=1 FL=1